MPRNHTEGDIPLIAVATGEADQTECVLWKMGIDQAEFTQPSTGGRVQFYVNNGSDLGPGTPPAEQLWGTPATLANYDMVVLPCMGMPVTELPADQSNLIAYTGAGGRVFATHYSYAWLDNDPPFSDTAGWFPNGDPNSPSALVGTIDTSFVEGQSFATWLQDVGALSAPDQISLENVRYDVLNVVPPTNQFIYAPQQVLQLGFFTPGRRGRGAAVRARRLHRLPRQRRGERRRRRAVGRHDVPRRVLHGPAHSPGEGARVHALRSGVLRAAAGPELHAADLPAAAHRLRAGGRRMRRTDRVRHVPREGHVRGRRRLRAVRLPGRRDVRPRTCQEQGFDCGSNGDGCGGAIQCGSCTAPQICGGGGQPSVCGS
jgi:hypothetical protein